MGRTKNDLIELITKKGEIVPADTPRGYYLVDSGYFDAKTVRQHTTSASIGRGSADDPQ
jgi:hypothetical protein